MTQNIFWAVVHQFCQEKTMLFFLTAHSVIHQQYNLTDSESGYLFHHFIRSVFMINRVASNARRAYLSNIWLMSE